MRAFRRSVQIGFVLVIAVGALVGAAGPAQAEPICVDTSDYIAEGHNEVCVDLAEGRVHVIVQPRLGLVGDPVDTVYLTLDADGGDNRAQLTLTNGSTVVVERWTDETGQRHLTVCVEIIVLNEPVGDCITRPVP